MIDEQTDARITGAIIGDCAWCGAEIESKPKPAPRSVRGEQFCSTAHRDASARAVRRLRDRDGAVVGTSTEEPACRCSRFDHEHDEGCPAYCAEDDEPGTPTDEEARGLAARWARIRSSRDIRRELVRHTALGVPKYHPAPEQVYMAKVDRERLFAWVRERMRATGLTAMSTLDDREAFALELGRLLDINTWDSMDDESDEDYTHAWALCEASGWPS